MAEQAKVRGAETPRGEVLGCRVSPTALVIRDLVTHTTGGCGEREQGGGGQALPEDKEREHLPDHRVRAEGGQAGHD